MRLAPVPIRFLDRFPDRIAELEPLDTEDFLEAVLKGGNLGDDADTTGAVCGQFAGAYWGASGIPPEWLENLAKRDTLETTLNRSLRG